MSKRLLLTQESYKKLLDELHCLTTKKRKEIALRFKEAFEEEGFPDGELIDEEIFVENRIKQINKILARARVTEQEDSEGDRVRIGSHVVLKDLESQEEMEFKLVSSVEADVANHKLSDESPVGKAIRGKRAGQVAKARAPQGFIDYQIVAVGKKLGLTMANN